MSCLERLEVVPITQAAGGALHFQQRLERAHAKGSSRHVNLDGLGVELSEARNLRHPLENVDVTHVGGHQRPVADGQERANRARCQEPVWRLDPPAQGLEGFREPGEILLRGIRHQVDIAGAAHVPPRVHGQSTDQDELDASRREPLQQSAEIQAHRLAAPRKVARNSLKARPSARFTDIGLRAWSRRRRRMTASSARQESSRCSDRRGSEREVPTGHTVRLGKVARTVLVSQRRCKPTCGARSTR